jgi:hypothetical protein
LDRNSVDQLLAKKLVTPGLRANNGVYRQILKTASSPGKIRLSIKSCNVYLRGLCPQCIVHRIKK